MMRKFFALAITSLISVSALAAEGQPYVYGDYSATKLNNANPFPNPGAFDFGIGYKFHPNFAAEFGYTFFGNSTVDFGFGTATLKSSSFRTALVGLLPLQDKFSAFGKLGFARNKVDLSGSGLLAGITASDSKNSLYWGLGLNYQFSEQVGLHVQYQNYGDFESGANPMSATAFSFGASYSF